MGPFYSYNAAFAAFLQRRGADASTDRRFVARNFLLDEGVRVERAASYDAVGVCRDHGDDACWQTLHGAYLYEAVNRPRPPGLALDPHDPDHCPETFRMFDPATPFLTTDLGRDLVRAESLDFIARAAGEPVRAVRTLATEVAHANSVGRHAEPAHSDLDAILDEWYVRSDGRPVFAGFWEDVRDLFGARPDHDIAGWADELRDRFGLAHHDPGQLGDVAVLLLRYPVRDVQRVLGTDRSTRLLMTPTVLDGSQSTAFCPAPSGVSVGHTVELGGRYELPRREVLHPPVAFRARHVLRCGVIHRPAPVDLASARALHLLYLQETSSRIDYAATTDEDLLR